MGESDDDFEARKSRDKFRRERSDYDSRGRVGKREVYEDRNGRGGSASGGGGGDFNTNKRYGAFRERTSPGQSEPPFKRTRRDYPEDSGDTRSSAVGAGSSSSRRETRQDQEYPTQPPMLTVKQYLLQLDDHVSADEAMLKYTSYREDFARTQLQTFFSSHKDEEWFKEKYHPDFYDKKNSKIKGNVQKRLEVFMDLMNKGWTEDNAVHVDNTDKLVKFIDAVVIMLEGGTENDLRVLDMKEQELLRSESVSESKKISVDKKGTDESKKSKSRQYSHNSDSSDDESSSSSSSSSSDSDSDREDKPARRRRKSKSASSADKPKPAVTAPVEEPPPKPKSTDGAVSSEEEGENKGNDDDKEVGEVNDDVDEDAPTPTTAERPVESLGDDLAKPSRAPNGGSSSTVKPTDAAGDGPGVTVPQNGPPPRPLHRTYSIFLRSLHPDITRVEIEELCKSYNGFLRLALQDPAPDRKFSRRGWVTFDRSVNIKEICWNLNNIRLKECDLGAIVNRELTQRIRPVMVLANHKPVMRQDIKFAARMVQKLDQRHGLWQDPQVKEGEAGEKGKVASVDYSITSKNPLMKNITDYLVDEGSYEEEALLGSSGGMGDDCNPSEISIDSDMELARVLDRLILYLRVVHSVDYYSATEYPNEDEMPHRCGILHARGAHTEPDKPISQRNVDDYMKFFESKVSHLIEYVDRLSDSDSKKLGLKDVEEAAEKFILDNTQELGKEKWLCPLSGKKFKGPDFVRKHIINKHAERLEQEKKEAEFYNHYIRDPKRPQLPEHPGTSDRDGGHGGVSSSGRLGDNYDRAGGSSRGPGGSGDYGRPGYNGGGDNYPPYRSYAPFDYNNGPMRSSNYYPRDSYRSPPPGGYGMRDNYSYNNRTPYDRSDRSGGGNTGGGNYYNKRPNYQNNYSGQKNYSGRSRFGGGYSRKMMNYTDLDAPHDD